MLKKIKITTVPSQQILISILVSGALFLPASANDVTSQNTLTPLVDTPTNVIPVVEIPPNFLAEGIPGTNTGNDTLPPDNNTPAGTSDTNPNNDNTAAGTSDRVPPTTDTTIPGTADTNPDNGTTNTGNTETNPNNSDTTTTTADTPVDNSNPSSETGVSNTELTPPPPALPQSPASTSVPSSSVTAKIADTPGLTSLQSTTGAAIQSICAGLASRNTITATPQSAESDLFNQCNAMVHTSNAIQGSGPTTNSLNLNSAELGGALQNIATEEMATPSRISISTLSGQLAEINTHLFELHKFSQGLGGSGGDDDSSLLSNRLSPFVNGFGGFGDIEKSDRENDTDFYSAGVILGVDYRFTNNFVAGIAGSYSYLDTDFQRNINVSGGGVDADTYSVSLFSSYDLENFYVDGSFSYGWSDFDLERGVVILSNNASSTGGANRVASSSPDGEQYSGGLGFGYNINQAAFNIRPYARMEYYHGNIEKYSESGAFGLNLTVDEQNFESLQSLLGTQLSYASSHSFGVIIPQINFAWHHEFLNKSRAINARYTADFNQFTMTAVTNSPDQDYFTLGAGLSSVLQGGTQLFFNYQSLLGYSDINSHSFEAGVRIEF